MQKENEAGGKIPFPKEFDYSLSARGPVKASFSDVLKKKFQGLLYLIHHVRTAGIGPRALEVPPAELADPWSVVMGRAGIGFLGEELNTYLTGYGYGGPDTPAVFGERMFDTNTIIGAALSDPIMWQNGTQAIWKGVANDLNVRTGAAVESITRAGQATGAIQIRIKGSSGPEIFDKLILAVDPRAALKMIEPTREESALFSQVKYMPYATFAVRVSGLAAGRSEVGYLRENMTLERQGWPMAWISSSTSGWRIYRGSTIRFSPTRLSR